MTLLFAKLVVTGVWHVLANCAHNLNLFLFVLRTYSCAFSFDMIHRRFFGLKK